MKINLIDQEGRVFDRFSLNMNKRQAMEYLSSKYVAKFDVDEDCLNCFVFAVKGVD